MNILFISHKFHPDIGGIEVHSEILAGQFSQFGADVHLLTWTKEEGRKSFPYKVIRDPNVTNLIKEFLWADVIYENNPTIRLSWPNLFFNKSHVISLHTWISRDNNSLKKSEKIKTYWVRKADDVIAVSNSVRKKTFKKAEVIPNPYRADLFRQIEGIEKNRDFVFLGRLVSDKGADMAIDLIRKLSSNSRVNICQPTLTVIGDGPEKETLIKKVKEYDLSQQVKFVGYLEGEELNTELNSHKYLLVPSRWEEPFGIVVLEGMACGCLPIVSDGGGLPQAVGEAGVTFERNNLNSLIDVVEQLLDNPELEMKFRMKCEEHLARHTTEVIGDKYFEVIKSVCKS